MTLRDICDLIILIGALVVAILNIYKFFAKPGSFLKQKMKKESQERIKEIFDELMPKYLEEHDLQTREKYLADRKRYLQEITNEVLSHIEDDLKQIKESNVEQNETIDILKKQAVDVLRQKIERIYYDYRDKKEIPQFALENLEELYADYTRGGGNHHITKLYKRMKTWKITDEKSEYDDE